MNDTLQINEIPETAEPGMMFRDVEQPQPKPERPEQKPFVTAAIKEWNEKILAAKDKWKPDFERMRENEEFVAGMQWNGQKTIRTERYVANLTIRAINQKVASLYARDPELDVKRREKRDYAVWDGQEQSLIQSVTIATHAAMSGFPPPPEAEAIIRDFEQGQQINKLLTAVADTYRNVYQYQIDTQEPEFKTQAKQWVRRTCVCGVGYIRVNFCRDYENELTQSETRSTIQDRAKQATYILERFQTGEIDDTDSSLETLRSLVTSLNPSTTDSQTTQVKERLVFDFPPATSIIPDPNTRALKGFVGARWIAEEYILPLDFVNAFFEANIDKSDAKCYKDDGTEYESSDIQDKAQPAKARLFEVFDLDTRSTFIICDGWHDHYVVAPEPVESTSSFWPIFALTFNDIETEAGSKATIFPPSDVDLIRPAQKEWNRTRDSLRKHRRARTPRHVVPKGVLTDKDIANINAAEEQQVVELEGLTPGTEPGKIIQPLMSAPIEMEVYDTRPLAEDIMFATGQQEANIGPAQPNVTATVGTIAEQSRLTVTNSNVDDLDDCLSAVANCGFELLIRNMSSQTIIRIVGNGAVPVTDSPDDFLNEIQLKIKAGSSGRPNKAIETQNFQLIAPMLLQAGANPIAVIEEGVKRLDEKLDIQKFFPLGLNSFGAPPMAPPSQGDRSATPMSPNRSVQQLPNGGASQFPPMAAQSNHS